MKKALKLIINLRAVLLIIALLFGATGYYVITPKYKWTEFSPDGKYKLDVYEEPLFFAFPGGGGDNLATLVLRGKDGRFIGKVTGESDSCGVMSRNLEISWHDEYVMYARVRVIYFATGACE